MGRCCCRLEMIVRFLVCVCVCVCDGIFFFWFCSREETTERIVRHVHQQTAIIIIIIVIVIVTYLAFSQFKRSYRKGKQVEETKRNNKR